MADNLADIPRALNRAQLTECWGSFGGLYTDMLCDDIAVFLEGSRPGPY